MQAEVFEIAKASDAGWLPFALLVPTLLLIGATWLFWPRTLSVEVHADKLTLSGSVYGRSIPRAELVTERLRIVDLNSDPELRFSYRQNGVGLPGYNVGWFKLKGGQRALAFVTDRREVVYLPTRNGYALLLSVRDRDAFARALGASLAEPAS